MIRIQKEMEMGVIIKMAEFKDIFAIANKTACGGSGILHTVTFKASSPERAC